MVLAMYDFAAKQEFIYRTSKIKEISGASALLSNIYKNFIEEVNNAGKNIKLVYDVGREFSMESFKKNTDIDGEVLYDGGGNLMILYRNRDIYESVNRIVSVYLLKKAPTLQMITCCVECEGNFSKDRKNLYSQNRINKNFYPVSDIIAVTPVTQVDPMTFRPVVHKDKKEELSLSDDRLIKREAYRKYEAKALNDLENLEGLTAVIYIDGNSMGKKLMKCEDSDYDKGVKKLREFSENVNRDFVETPLGNFKRIIEESDEKGFRRVIGGGDEITVICDAKIALKLLYTYFETLESENEGKPEDDKNYSCAGIAVFHAKSPFSIAYEIAEEACESAKEKAHAVNGNYFDFYYCHAGVTTDFDTLRKNEQSISRRPYSFTEAKDLFERYTPLLQAAGRSNVKELGNAAQLGKAKYLFEVERVNAYLKEKGSFASDEAELAEEMGIVYDMSEFYDLWFAKFAWEDEEKDEDEDEKEA